VKTLAASGLKKADDTPPAEIGPSANAIKMQLTGKLLSLGVNNPAELALNLFAEFGADALINTEQFVS